MHGMWDGDEMELVYWCVTMWVLGVDNEHSNGHEEEVKIELHCKTKNMKEIAASKP